MVVASTCHGILDFCLYILCTNRTKAAIFEHIFQLSGGFAVLIFIGQEDIVV